jgi:tetratricopeptide (TPR) repeat protein
MTLRSLSLLAMMWMLPPQITVAPIDLEQKLIQDIDDYRLDHFSRVEAAFILSGATAPDSLHHYVAWYQGVLRQLRDYHFDTFDRIGSAAKVFGYLHTTWLVTYKERATTLLDVVRYKQFNCVAGTILYNLLCADLGWPTDAYETPTHTYTLFSNFEERVMVENTTPYGFNIMRNLREYSRYLLQFYPDNRAAQIGFDRLYAYENSQGRQITNTELLGLLAYNRAYLADEKGQYKEAYDFVRLAQKFNRDSRSNIQFEINLYNRWGKNLYDQGRFYEAFTVLADGYYRYPHIKELAANCFLSFFRTLNQRLQEDDWPASRNLLEEFTALKISFAEQEQALVRPVAAAWVLRLKHEHQQQPLQSALELFGRLGFAESELAGSPR